MNILNGWMHKEHMLCVYVYTCVYDVCVYISVKPSHELKSHQFYHRSGHTSGLQARSLVGVCKRQPIDVSLLVFFPPCSISENKYSNMVGAGVDYVKQNKSDREWKILHNLMYMWNLKKSNSIRSRQ